MRQNKTKFGLDREVEFKKSLELYYQILVRVVTKVPRNFIHFAWLGQKGANYNKHLRKFLSQFNQM
jgi:hypothetical protein